MQFWNGVAMYAPLPPEHYAIPGTQHCIFRLMQQQGDTQAWNLYWLSHPATDYMLSARSSWFHHYQSLTSEQTEAFYAALDTVVFNRLTLATLVSQPPREAIRLLERAHLERCRFYTLFGGERWRQAMLGRLFLAARRNREPAAPPPARDADVVWLDAFARHYPRHHFDGTGTDR